MSTLSLVIVPLVVAVPVRDIEFPDTSWVGKTVFAKASGLRLDPSPEPLPMLAPNTGVAITGIQYRVYAERPEHVQLKNRDGVSGWVRKDEVVLLDDAVAFFTMQVLLNPKDAAAYSRRASAWRAKADFDAAIGDATIALKLNPNAAYYNNRALIWHAKRDYDKAIADFSMALQMSPQYPLALVNRSLMWHSKKEYDKTIADTTQALQLDTKYPMAHRARGIAHHGKKAYDNAIADLTRALELDPKYAQARAERGNAWAAKHDYAKALDDYNEALRMESNNVAVLAHAALWLASCPNAKYRDAGRALELARKAQQLERTNTLAIQALAAAHAELGQFPDAIRWQEHAMQDPLVQADANAEARLKLYREMKAYRQD